MRLHTYRAGTGAGITQPDVDAERPLREVIVVEEDETVFIVNGDEVEIDLNLRLVEIFGEGPGHVLVHPCHRLAVMADYMGRTARFEVHVATLVKAVLAEAVDKLKIDTVTAADLVLRLAGTTQDLAATNPIGTYVPKGRCEIAIDLVHAVRPQG